MAAVVSSVAGVVGDHGPPSEGPGGQGEDGDEVHAQSHGQKADGRAGVGPADHLVEMTDVGVSLLLLELIAQGIEETLTLLRKEQDGSLRGVFHCFGSSLEEAKAINELGFHLGLGGVSTFKNSGMDKVIPHLDMNYIILETDCPYLAPAPNRGKRNEPAYTELVAKRIAELRGITLEEVEAITTANSKSLFNL